MSYENFNPEDLVILSYITKPSGGFWLNKIPQGIKAIHVPTSTTVACESDRSQHRNRHLALTELWEQVQGKPTYDELLAENESLKAEIRIIDRLLSKYMNYEYEPNEGE